MWLKSLMVAAGCIPMLWSIHSAGQTATNHTVFTLTNSASGPATRILRSTNGNIIIITTNALGPVSGRTFRAQQPKDSKPFSSAALPGVYSTEPYTCIVIVPVAHPDDQSVIHPPEPAPNMPVLKPDLRFVPLRPK
jgi:hypothetical protein